MKFLHDFLPVVLFFATYWIAKQSYTVLEATIYATAVAMLVAVVQLAWSWFRHRRLERMPLIAAVLLLFFGGLTIIFQDDTFIKWKPTIVNWLFGAAFLGSQWIGKKTLVERMMSAAVQLPDPVWRSLNMAWVIFFIVVGIINIYVAYSFDTDTWVTFKLFGMLGLTVIFVIIQAFYLARYMDHSTPDSANKE